MTLYVLKDGCSTRGAVHHEPLFKFSLVTNPFFRARAVKMLVEAIWFNERRFPIADNLEGPRRLRLLEPAAARETFLKFVQQRAGNNRTRTHTAEQRILNLHDMFLATEPVSKAWTLLMAILTWTRTASDALSAFTITI